MHGFETCYLFTISLLSLTRLLLAPTHQPIDTCGAMWTHVDQLPPSMLQNARAESIRLGVLFETRPTRPLLHYGPTTTLLQTHAQDSYVNSDQGGRRRPPSTKNFNVQFLNAEMIQVPKDRKTHNTNCQIYQRVHGFGICFVFSSFVLLARNL